MEIVNNVRTPPRWLVRCSVLSVPDGLPHPRNLFFNRLTVSNCAVLGEDNVLADPLYVDGFHLGDGSPGIDSGDDP